MNEITPPPWGATKCGCGERGCDRWRINHAGPEGMFSETDALLITSAPGLKAFVDMVANMTTYQDDGDGVDFDDAVDTMNRLIFEAKKLSDHRTAS